MKLTRLLLSSLALSGGALVALHAQAPATVAPAAPAAAASPVQVTCDKPDWNYALGEVVKFSIRVTDAGGKPAAGVSVSYTVGPEMMTNPSKTVVTGADGMATIEGGTMKVPGFLRCIATIQGAGAAQRGLATAAFAREQIKPTQTEPTDFDAFWAKGKADLAALPIDARLTPLPEESNDKIEVFQVSLQNVGTAPSRSSRFYGILCVPRGEGPFPAMMVPPGAGIRKLTGEKGWAERGFITLQVGIHGVPVTLPAELYASLGGAIGGYATMSLDERDRYYFRRVILGCLRANDYLASHPKWDRKNLVDFGGSQGGYLSITTTALDPRVTAIVAAFPAFCDVSGYAHERAGGWPGMRFLGDKASPARDLKLANTAYYDAVNFAKRIKVPGHYGWGYNDETCPPTSMFSAYNVITAQKSLSIFKEMGHPRVPGLTVAEREWLAQRVAFAK